MVLLNSPIIALPSIFAFQSDYRAGKGHLECTFGTLSFPIPRQREPKPGGIAEKQHRALALMPLERAGWSEPVKVSVDGEGHTLRLGRDKA